MVEINNPSGNEKTRLGTCGVIMPISGNDECDAQHWSNVKEIIFSVIEEAEMTPNLVSDSLETGVIQKSIVQNIYTNEIVICDVSCKNPNVMLELGMRLAFDKPVIIVKDDKTNYSFDSSPIFHLNYPRDLRYNLINEFRDNLLSKVVETKSGTNKNSFLKSFGSFKVAEISSESAPISDIILDEIRGLKSALGSVARTRPLSRADGVRSPTTPFRLFKQPKGQEFTICAHCSAESIENFLQTIEKSMKTISVDRQKIGIEHEHIKLKFEEPDQDMILAKLDDMGVLQANAALNYPSSTPK